MSTTVKRTELGVHVAMIKGQLFTGYFGQIKGSDAVTVATYDNTANDFTRAIEQLTSYVGRHRRRVTLAERLRLFRLGIKRTPPVAPWPVLVKHVATTPAMQQIPYDWSAIDF